MTTTAKIIRVTSPAPREEWAAIAAADQSLFIHQTPLGMDAICASLDVEDSSRLYEFSDGRRHVLPLFRSKTLPSRLSVEQTPQIGGLVSQGAPQKEEVRAILEELRGRKVLRTILRPSALTGHVWTEAAPPGIVSRNRRSHVLDLRGGFETVWTERFNSQARRNVRKAEKSAINVECDSTGRLVPVFYDLLQRSVDRWASKRYEPLFLARWRAQRRDPLERFQRMSDVLGEAYKVWVAYVNGEPAASVVMLLGKNAHYTRGAMDIDLAGPVRASFLLQKLAIEEACKAGCHYYNMGATGTSETLARFKSHFGARPYTFSEYRLERLPFTRIELQSRRVAERLAGMLGTATRKRAV